MKKLIVAIVAVAALAGFSAAIAVPNIVTAGNCPVHMVPMNKCPQGMMHP